MIGVSTLFGALPTPFACVNEGVCLWGDGPDNTVIRSALPGPALDASFSRFYAGNVLMKDLTFTTSVPQTGPALRFAWPSIESAFQPCVNLSNLSIRPDPVTALETWPIALDLVSTWYANVADVQINGNLAVPVPLLPGSLGIRMSGRASVLNFQRVVAAYKDIGFLIDGGEVQGVTLDTCIGLLCSIGFWARCDAAKPQPQVNLDKCHFSTLWYGAVLDYMDQSSISKCLFYRNENATRAEYFGIAVRNSQGARLRGNHVTNNATTGQSVGIAIHAGYAHVAGLTGQGLDTMVWLGPTSHHCKVEGLVNDGCKTRILNQGTSNVDGNGSPLPSGIS